MTPFHPDVQQMLDDLDRTFGTPREARGPLTPGDFARTLIEGTKQFGLHWQTVEDLFAIAMRQGMPS